MATHSSTLAQKIPWTEEPGIHGVAKSRTQLSDFTFKATTHTKMDPAEFNKKIKSQQR